MTAVAKVEKRCLTCLLYKPSKGLSSGGHCMWLGHLRPAAFRGYSPAYTHGLSGTDCPTYVQKEDAAP